MQVSSFAGRLSLCALIAVMPLPLKAQTPRSASASASSAPVMGNYQSTGIKATIISILKTEKGFSVQMLINNLRGNPIYISPITSGNPNAVGVTALSASGMKYMIENAGEGVVGMGACHDGNRGHPFPMVIDECVKTFDINAMTRVEVGQNALFGATYIGTGDPGAFVSFGLTFLVRDVAVQSDASDSLRDSPASAPAAAPPKIVSISFGLVPFKRP